MDLRARTVAVKTMMEIDGELMTVKLGYRILLNDAHTELREGQKVWRIAKPMPGKPLDDDIYSDYEVHGTKIYFSRRHKSFTVTSPCMPHRNRLGQLMWHRGRVIVIAPTKFVGMDVLEFVSSYGSFGCKVFEILKQNGELKWI